MTQAVLLAVAAALRAGWPAWVRADHLDVAAQTRAVLAVARHAAELAEVTFTLEEQELSDAARLRLAISPERRRREAR